MPWNKDEPIWRYYLEDDRSREQYEAEWEAEPTYEELIAMEDGGLREDVG